MALAPKTQIITPADRSAWLRARQRDITASVVGVLFGVHNFITPLELWASKTGRHNPDIENEAMVRGNAIEPNAAIHLSALHPEWVIDYNTSGVVNFDHDPKTGGFAPRFIANPNYRYFRDPAARLGATPDVIVTCPQRGKGIVQIKSVEPNAFKAKWFDDDGGLDVPLYIALQAMLEAHLTGAQWAAVMPYVVRIGIEAPLIEIPLDNMSGVIAAMTEKSAEFWQMVAEGREPEPDYARDGALIDNIFRVGDPFEEADLTQELRLLGMIEERAAQGAVKMRAEASISAIDAEIKMMLGNAEIGHLPNGRTLTWKTHRRRDPATGRASVYRVLRYPKI